MPTISTHRLFPWHGLLVAGIFSVGYWPLAHADELIVVTDRRHPVRAPDHARVIKLDEPERIEAELSAGLSDDTSSSAALVRKRLEEGGKRLQQDIAKAYQDVVDAWSLGVTTLPAVVLDRRFVVYGEPDVFKAVERIAAHRKEQP